MIVFEDKKLLIITPPHTASGYLNKFYCEKGAYCCIGPNPDGIIDHHYTNIHNAWTDFTKVLVVRRPFERLVGLYEHYNWWAEIADVPMLTWENFVYGVITNDKNIPWFYKYTIFATMIMSNTKPDIIWQYEKLNEPPCGLETPNFNPPQKDYLQYEHLKSLINIWGEKDLEYYA